MLERGGVVDFDFEARAIDIQFLAAACHAEAEARAAGDFGGLCTSIAGQIEGPDSQRLFP